MSTPKDPNPCRIIGVLDNGTESLAVEALAHIQRADVVIAGTRLLEMLSPQFKPEAIQHDLTGQLKSIPEWISSARDANLSCVVLATGDPLCYGIAHYIIAHICPEAIEVLPNLSTIQLAFAKLGIAWQDAKLASVHSKDAGEWRVGATPDHGLYKLAQLVRRHRQLAVLTSPANTPDRIARLLLAEGLGEDFQMAVISHLCQADEQVEPLLTPNEAANRTFPTPNVVLLWRTTPLANPVQIGLPDASYHQRKPEKGLITKCEIRAVSLARMQLRRDSLVWDIGAGSGSVGLEAARLCPEGHVWAIEKNTADAEIARQNQAKMSISNYTLIEAKAPDNMDNWPSPNAIFIGGSGGNLPLLISHCLASLQPEGWLVMNFVTLENLAEAIETVKACDANWDVVQLQASRSKPVLHLHRMAAENPVWMVCAQAPKMAETE